MKGHVKASHRQKDRERARKRHTVSAIGIDGGAQRTCRREGLPETEGDERV